MPPKTPLSYEVAASTAERVETEDATLRYSASWQLFRPTANEFTEDEAMTSPWIFRQAWEMLGTSPGMDQRRQLAGRGHVAYSR